MRYREIVEACWKGYVQRGMKPKGDRMVPNCVPVRELEEDLRKWFKQKWVRFGPDGKIRGDCARGKKGRATAAGRKRRQDPNANRKGAAKNVKTK